MIRAVCAVALGARDRWRAKPQPPGAKNRRGTGRPKHPREIFAVFRLESHGPATPWLGPSKGRQKTHARATERWQGRAVAGRD